VIARIEVISDSAALEALESEWWHLFRRCPLATPFQSPAWLITWWQVFSPGELHVVTVRYANELIAVAPFYVEHGAARRVLPVGISLSDYIDVLIDPAHLHRGIQALRHHLHHTRSEWEEWEWSELRPEAIARCLETPTDCSEQHEVCNVCPTLQLPLHGALNSVVPEHCLRNLHGDWKRIERVGSTCFVEASTADAECYFALLTRFVSERLQARGERHYLCDAQVQRFHRQVIPKLIDAKLLKLYAMLLNDQAIAVHYLLGDAFASYSYLTGFDQARQRLSPGTVLLGHVIEQSLRRGKREFHFLRGAEKYKYYWGASDRLNVRRVFEPAWTARRHRGAPAATPTVEEQYL